MTAKTEIALRVEARWGYCTHGELGLGNDPQLLLTVVRMWREVERQRRYTKADEHTIELDPIENQVVDALSIILSPELNGA